MLTLILLLLAVAALSAVVLHRRKRKARANWAASEDYPVRESWTGASRALNYSSFVYLDVDRDGHYGTGDRPMAGAVVRLRGESGHRATARSNINGFANFRMLRGGRKAPINRPGKYEFTVAVPRGWRATSANEIQARDFREVAGSIAGLGSDEMVRPVGLAPSRFVRGTLPPDRPAVAFLHRGEEEVTRQGIEGSFQLAVPEGADRMLLRLAGYEREIVLGAYPVDLGRINPSRPAANGVSPTTICFDDLSARGLRKIPNGYAGLDWSNLNVIRRDLEPAGQGYVNGNTSGDHMAYMSSGHPAEFSSGTLFDFIGAMLTVAWLQAEGETVIVESWRGTTPVARDEIGLSALAPVQYLPAIAGVTRVRFSTHHYWQVVIDDLTIAR